MLTTYRLTPACLVARPPFGYTSNGQGGFTCNPMVMKHLRVLEAATKYREHCVSALTRAEFSYPLGGIQSPQPGR